MKNNKPRLIRFTVFIALLCFVLVVGYKFITEGIQDAVFFSPVIDDFIWGAIFSLVGVVSLVIAFNATSVFVKSRYVVQSALFSVVGLTMLFNGLNALF